MSAFQSPRPYFVVAIILALLVAVVLWSNLSRQKTTETTGSTPTNPAGYDGTLIAGSTTPFYEFTPLGYETAKKEGKVILLNFAASWSGISTIAEAPVLKAGFDGLKTDKLVGFRVHYKDGANKAVEDQLAQEFDVQSEHTKVIVKKGKVISKTTESWTDEDFIKETTKALE